MSNIELSHASLISGSTSSPAVPVLTTVEVNLPPLEIYFHKGVQRYEQLPFGKPRLWLGGHGTTTLDKPIGMIWASGGPEVEQVIISWWSLTCGELNIHQCLKLDIENQLKSDT